MTCNRVWRHCFVKHLNIPKLWRNDDADKVLPVRQDVFCVTVPYKQVDYLLDFIKDEDHRIRVKHALIDPSKEYMFIICRNGNFVQYFPYMNMTEEGVAWRPFEDVAFSTFDELNRMFPPIRRGFCEA